MKKLLILPVFCLIYLKVSAQKDAEKVAPEVPKTIIEVKEDKRKMSQGYYNGLTVFIPEARLRDVEQGLTRYMKNYDAKGDEKKGEYFFDNATIKQFGNNPVDAYAVVTQKEGGAFLEVYFDLGGTFLNSKDHPEKYEVAERMVHDFAKEQAVFALEEQVGTSQKTLAVSMQAQETLIRQDSSLTRKIRDCQETIRESEEAIKLNREQQATGQADIESQQKAIEMLKARQTGIE